MCRCPTNSSKVCGRIRSASGATSGRRADAASEKRSPTAEVCSAPVATETHEDFAEPILPGKGASDYERYLRTDELLALQKSPDERTHPDELLFQTVHQSSELWLKLATSEVERATVHLRAGAHAAALRLLRRASLCLQFITAQLDMLEQMSPWEYQIIRRVLGHGSGFDSPGFREVRRVTPPLGEAFDAPPGQAGADLVEAYVPGREQQQLYQLGA